jgi:hypothetical protein
MQQSNNRRCTEKFPSQKENKLLFVPRGQKISRAGHANLVALSQLPRLPILLNTMFDKINPYVLFSAIIYRKLMALAM